ncbi:unnamed protein product [Vicia faba]|uniref:F-box domain-containing protein n=2 Tax=Vicia faba TaxID=3906 RepID=A0AAV1BAP8_VICFA|nr:unnamed protein product [Vicia faba]
MPPSVRTKTHQKHTSPLRMNRDQHENGIVLTHPLSPSGDESRSDLPEELIVEILLRLPVRSLVQFKCICKSWKTLISDPKFVKRHLQISSAEPNLIHLFFSQLSEPQKIVSYPLKPLFQNILPPVNSSGMMKMKNQYWIIGSCNGLLCMYNRYHHCVKLRNPSIMFKSNKSPRAVSFEWMNILYGFGFDRVNDKYKVLLVVRNKNDPNQILTRVYTFGLDSWKTIPNFQITPTGPFSLLGKFVSGNLNWIAKKRVVSVSSSQIVILILSFDLEKETCKELLLPQHDGDKVYGHTLYVLSNCLGVCYETNKTHWVVWLMKEYGVVESWTKFMIIPLDKFNKPPAIVIPVFVLENGAVLLVNKYTSQFVLYDLNTGELDYSLDYSLKGISNFRHNLHICCESLVSL